MRRLWAHIIIAFTCIVAVFAAFPSALNVMANNGSTNGDYRTRRQFTFQLAEKKQENESDIIHLEDDSAKKMAVIMEERLIAAGVTSYEINTEGNDIVNVAFTADNATQYLQITTYLGFSGSFALMNQDPDSEPIPASEFLNGKAYLISDINQYPTIVVPVNTETEAYKNVIQYAKDNPVESEADEEGNTTKSYPVYLIYNYVKGDTYKTLTDTNRFNEKILITLNAESDDTLYYNADHNSFSQVCGYSDANQNGYADADEVKAAYDQADFLYNLFNASALDYDVKVIRGIESGTEVWLSAKVEGIKVFGKFAFTRTLLALVASIVVVSLLLVVFYRLGALSIVTTSLVSAFLTFLFMVLSGMEYNVLAVVGIIIVASLSLISGVYYFSRLKDESYRGRTLKKANSEAARKSILPIVDLHVVAVVIGLMVYLLGGSAVHSFASLLILGSLAGIIINTLGLRGLAWLVTNTTGLTGKYELFAIDGEKVPNHMAEEKQSYFGPYQDKDFSARKKPLSILAVALFVLSFVGVGLMGGLNGGNLYRNSDNKVIGSDIYVVDTIRVFDDEKSSMNEESVKEILSNIKLYNTLGETVTFDDADQHKTLDSYINKISSFVTSESETIEGTTYNYSHYYFAVNLNQYLDGDKVYAKVKDVALAEESTLNQVFEIYFEELNFDYNSSVSNSVTLKTIETYNNVQEVKWDKIALGTFIAILIITLYLLIRYRLSRGLASLFFPILTSTVTLGIFILPGLIGLAMPSALSISIPVVAIITYAIMIAVSTKERDLIADDRSRDISFEHRQELSKSAVSIGYVAVLSILSLFSFIAICFFGFGPTVYSYIYIAFIVGALLALLFVSCIYMPVSNWLYELFSGINFNIKPRKNKKNTNVKQKSAEPEEAIFIGIND